MITIKEKFTHIEEIKKSIFTTFVSSANLVEEAMEFIKENSNLSATHNCWGYSINGEYRFTDDGEPSSTAGKPIYSAIEHSGLNNVVVLVIRESSGIKLGTGGLIRAYGGCTTKALKLAEKIEIKETILISFKTSFSYIGEIYHIANEFNAKKESEEFKSDGVEFSFDVEVIKQKEFKSVITNICNGEVEFEDIL